MNLDELQQRVARLESELNSVKADLAAARGTSQSTTTPISNIQVSPRPVLQKVKGPGFFEKFKEENLELLLGGNILGKLGLLAIVLAVAWFIKFAFDNQWVNESGRIYTGILTGFLIAAGALYLARQKIRVIPAPLMGAAISVLYIAVFSAYHYYDLLGHIETFVAMFVLSVLSTLLAVHANRESLYFFGLLGSYLAPIMLSRGENSYRFLFGYIGLIQAGLLWVSFRTKWKITPYLVLIATSGIWSAWAAKSLAVSNYIAPLLILIFTLIVFFGRIILQQRRGDAVSIPDLILLPLTSMFVVPAGYYLTQHHYPLITSHFLLFACGLHAAFYLFYIRGAKPAAEQGISVRTVPFYLILVLLFSALTDFYTERLLTVSWIVLAASLSLAAVTQKNKELLFTSVLLWVAVLFRLILIEYPQPRPFMLVLNARFAVFVLTAIALTLTYLLHKRDPFVPQVRGFAFAAMFVLVLGSLFENKDFVTTGAYRNLGYSYVLALYAAVFLGYGFTKDHKTMRLAGIFLAVIVVLKLYLYDIWTLSRLVRILAGFSLGVALVVLSILYQKYREKIMQIGKTFMGLALIPTLFALSGALDSSLHAEKFRAASFKQYSTLTPIRAGSQNPKAQYGYFTLSQDVLKTGTSGIRIAHNGTALPYFVRRAGEDETHIGTRVPEVVFVDNRRESTVYVLRFPAIPEDYVYTELSISSGGFFEAAAQVESASKPGDWEFVGHRSVFKYGDSSENRVRVDSGRNSYVRLTFNKTIEVAFPAVRIEPLRKTKEYSFEIPIDQIKKDHDSDRNATILGFPNSDRKQIERLVLTFEEPKFERSLEISHFDLNSKEYVSTGNTWLVRRAGDKPEQVIDMSNPPESSFKLTIMDGDDQPLKLLSATAYVPIQEAVFRLPDSDEEGELRVYFGNAYMHKPDYDIANTFEKKAISVEYKEGQVEENKEFAYSALEPPVSTWIIRIAFYLGLAALAFPAYKIFREYAQRLSEKT